MKRIIRLTESDLHRIIKESVKRILREEDFGSIGGGDMGGSDIGGDVSSGDIGEGVDEEEIAGASNAAQSGQFTVPFGKKNKFYGKALDHRGLCKFERV